MAALCYGVYANELFSPIEKAPYLLTIGPTEQINNAEIESSFIEFYKNYFCLSTDAIAKLSNRKLNEGGFYITTAKVIFKKFFKSYLLQLNNQNDIEKIIREKTIKANTQYLVDDHTKYKYCEATFNKHYKKFFMIDLYPENKDRFKFSFKDIMHELQLGVF